MDSSNDCFICAVNPLIFFARFNSFTVYTTCPHANPPSSSRFHESVKLKWCAFATVIFLIISSCMLISQFSELPVFDDALVSGVLIVISLTAAVMIYRIQLTMPTLLNQGNGVLFIIANKSDYQIDNIVGKKFQKTMNFILYFCYAPIMFVCLTFFVGRLLYFRLNSVQILEVGAIVMVVSTNVSLFAMALYYQETYFLLFRKCYGQIISILRSSFTDRKATLTERLKRVQKFHFDIFNNFLIMQEILKTNLLFCLLCSSITLIVDFYLVLRHKGHFSNEEIVVLAYSAGASVVATFMVIRSQQLYDLDQDATSCIFKYPISKLNLLESSQIEMLITTLKMQKPLLKASDLFTIKTSLIASVIGSVLTYVLVALQFQALWSK